MAGKLVGHRGHPLRSHLAHREPVRGCPATRGRQGTRCGALRERGCLCTPLTRNGGGDRRLRPCRTGRWQADRHRFAELGSADRSKQREPSARADERHERERGRPPAPRRAGTTADAAATAMLPGRALERDVDRRTPESSSRPRTRRRSARSPPSRCPRARAREVSDTVATRPPQGVRARGGHRPLIGRRHGCARRATANGERRSRTRLRARTGPQLPMPPPRPLRPAPAARSRRSPSQRSRPSTAAGTAGGARSSTRALPHLGLLKIDHRAIFPPAQDASR